MAWLVLDILGTIAFAVSGAIVAMEEEYDLIGVLVLGMVTTFGGGVVRNLLIGLPVASLWSQSNMLKAALVAMLAVTILPVKWIYRWKSWVIFFDAVGLSAFSIQGALYASEMRHPLSAILVAAVMTGIGGGIIRDVFARRKPLVLHDEIYAVWAILAGCVIGLHWISPSSSIGLFGLFTVIVVLRMLSVRFKWKLPRRSLKKGLEQTKERQSYTG